MKEHGGGEVANQDLSGEDPAGSSHPLSAEVLALLSIYEKAGIASRDRLEDIPPEHRLENLMPDYQSVIVLARVPREAPAVAAPGRFRQAIGTIFAQDQVIRYLQRYGYKSEIIGSRSTFVSLPRLGERAGVGQLSPFRTLAVKGHGLRTVLSAIVTDAPLEPSPLVFDACPRVGSCLKRCPALGADGVFDRSRCVSCGACVKKCPEGRPGMDETMSARSVVQAFPKPHWIDTISCDGKPCGKGGGGCGSRPAAIGAPCKSNECGDSPACDFTSRLESFARRHEAIAEVRIADYSSPNAVLASLEDLNRVLASNREGLRVTPDNLALVFSQVAPFVAVDNTLVFVGKTPSEDELLEALEAHRGQSVRLDQSEAVS